MKKLKLIQKRAPDSSPHDQDLRGLHETGLLSPQYPWTFLFVRQMEEEGGREDHLLLQKICDTLHLSWKESLDRKSKILFSKNTHQDHKQKSIVLFGAGLWLLQEARHPISLALGTKNTLADQIRGTPYSKMREESSELYENWSSLHPSQILQVSSEVKLFLEQVDVHFPGHSIHKNEAASIFLQMGESTSTLSSSMSREEEPLAWQKMRKSA